MMKILVTGAKGQLGSDVILELKQRGYEAIGVDIEEMDIINPNAVAEVVASIKPDGIIHCAAYTAVDKAEEEMELCRKINAEGTKNVALACLEQDCKMIYISTDYVFDGSGEDAWQPMDKRMPVNFYGQTKYEGERQVEELLRKYFIIRISWVFGQYGANFVDKMLQLAQTHEELKVVADQVGSPTYTADLRRLLVDMIESEKYGVYHAANEGYCSWYEFAKEIFAAAGLATKVSPVASEEFPTKAIRPKNSRLNKGMLEQNGFLRLPEWKDAVKRYLLTKKN